MWRRNQGRVARTGNKKITTAAATTTKTKQQKDKRQRTKTVQFPGDEADVGSCQRIWKYMPGIVEDPQSSKISNKHASLLAVGTFILFCNTFQSKAKIDIVKFIT